MATRVWGAELTLGFISGSVFARADRKAVVMLDAGFRQEQRQLAAALSEARIPFRLHTSLYIDVDSSRIKALGRFAPTLAQRLERVALRRFEPGIDSSAVRSWLAPEIIRRGLSALGIAPGRAQSVADVTFDAVSALLLDRRAPALIAMQGAAYLTLSRAQRAAVPTVLIANSPDPARQLAVVVDEEVRLGLRRRGAPTRAERAHAVRVGRELDLADLVVASSAFAAADIRGGGCSRRVEAIPLGVDVDRFAPLQTDSRDRGASKRVVYVGSVIPRKGIVYLAEAVASLRRSGVDCVLDLFGPVEPRYARLVSRALPSGRLHGPVSHDLLPQVYASADVFVLPTLSDAFGLVVYEALASGVPVVVTDRTGAEIRHDVDGLVVPHADAGRLAEQIGRLLTDADLSSRIAAAGRETALMASWARYRRAFLEIVCEVLR